MAVFISLLIGAQILCCLGVSPPRPEFPPPPPDRVISASCNSSSIKPIAELALDKLNEDRKQGYVVGLQRIFDARQLQWQGTGMVYYLTLDVLETDCHVLSRKSWKDCNFRSAHETVFGQCKITFYVNKPWRMLHMYNYDCMLRPIPPAVVVKSCPDCPTSDDPTKPMYLEAAAETLAKFNAESNHTHYFNLVNVTRARYQWVVGPSKFVEYVMQETTCSKSQAVDDLSKCPFVDDKTAEVGVCKGSVVESQIEHRKFITVHCEIFHPEPQVHQGQQAGDRKPGHQDGHQSHEHDSHHPEGRRERPHNRQPNGHHPHDHAEGRRERPHNRQPNGHHPHDHAEGRRERPHNRQPNGHHPHDHAEQEQMPHPFEASDLGKTEGRFVVLPSSDAHVSLHSLPEIEAERLDGMPVSTSSQGPKVNPVLTLPDIHGAPEENRPLGKPMLRPALIKPAKPITPPPFPAGFSQSDTCPGDILVFIYGLEPLLPKRHVELSPTGIPDSPIKEKGKH